MNCFGGGRHIAVSPAPVSYVQSTTAPAELVVTLPSDAVLTIDDRPTTSTSGTRRFVTPNLPRGKAYSYTLTAEIVRDGEKLKVTRTVAVRPGEATRVALEIPEGATAAK